MHYVGNVLSFNQTTYTGAIDDTLEVELVLDHPLNLESGELVVNVTYVSDEGSPEGKKLVIMYL